ncbi:hypothetical protein HDU67_004992 [Dinochytrium kinnereticum]|nr:hypothetical protein HDU67_004992 [Dinochytrium kinnereticum]
MIIPSPASGLVALALFVSSAVVNGLSINSDVKHSSGLMSQMFFEAAPPSRPNDHREGNIWDRLREEKDFSKFVELVEKEKGLRDEFERGERMTVFAPTNEAVERFEEREKERRRTERHRDIKMGDILTYHIVPDHEIKRDDMREGVLFKTNLELDSLDGERQRIRVSKLFNEIYLNMYARVNPDAHHRAENGQIWGVDEVLIPPPDMMDILYAIPTEFSTTVAALSRLGTIDRIREVKGGTLLVPDNAAWEKLGFRNLYHLFGDHGKEDLKKIMKYHGSDDLVYSTRIMRDRKVDLDSALKGERIHIEARRRGGGKRDDRRESPKDYIFVVNEGEARIRFTDGIAENGVLQIISEVLIPEGVELPDERRGHREVRVMG